MKFILIIAIFAGINNRLEIRVHEKTYTKEECETMSRIMKAENPFVQTVCIGLGE